MYLEAVFSFYVLLYHFVGHSFFGLIFFGSFSDIIKRNFSLTLAKLNFYVDMSVWLFVGKQYYCLTGMPPPYTEDGDLILDSVRRHFGPADPSAPELILEGNMALLIPRYLELQTQRNAEKRNYEHIEAEMRRLQGRIVAEMGRSCTAVCQGREAAYSISYKPVRKSGISKDNLQRLQAQHPDIYEQYVTVSESRRFYVKKTTRGGCMSWLIQASMSGRSSITLSTSTA